jgi:diadenosine tetraphosphatase ApaH/serine/threonine PP2A family protein phosphatase
LFASLQSGLSYFLLKPKEELMTRTIVIGDIHGCYDELVSLLKKAGLTANDRILAVGDLIVKGKKNKEVLDLFSSDKRFSSVIGNHDLAILKFWKGQKSELQDSQKRTCDELESERERYTNYLSSLPFVIDLGSHAVVHAGVRPGIRLDEQAPEDLTELRTLGPDRTSRSGIPWYEVYDDDKIILFGHWPSLMPRRSRHAIGLDTGCVYGNQLTAYILETAEFFQVPAKQAYEIPKTRFSRPTQ